ncbi:hypothetical protein Tco_1105640 [Tanacetum coccineum]
MICMSYVPPPIQTSKAFAAFHKQMNKIRSIPDDLYTCSPLDIAMLNMSIGKRWCGAAKGTSSPSITKDPPLTSTNGNAHGKDDDVGSVLDGEVLANDNGPQEPILSDCNKSVNEEVVKVQEKGSLWSRLKEVKEASTSKPKSPMMYLEEESDEDKVFLPDDDMSKYISSTSKGFNLDEDNLDCYDGYEARVYDLPEQMQAFCDHYDIRINSRVSERMYTFAKRHINPTANFHFGLLVKVEAHPPLHYLYNIGAGISRLVDLVERATLLEDNVYL